MFNDFAFAVPVNSCTNVTNHGLCKFICPDGYFTVYNSTMECEENANATLAFWNTTNQPYCIVKPPIITPYVTISIPEDLPRGGLVGSALEAVLDVRYEPLNALS
jgi:hypothetical protein